VTQMPGEVILEKPGKKAWCSSQERKVAAPRLPLLLNCHVNSPVILGHWDEHVMVVYNILVCCTMERHVGQYAQDQSCKAQVQFAKC
jgi:hypothetical protein